MKRPHRSIETFDISLMAVVTKAMGAFLVLMLLLMPYYRSGPIGQQEVQDLAKKVAEVDSKVKQAMEKLASASPEDLREELAEALKLLEEARKLNAHLARVIDALNSQVKRLEEEKETLELRVAELQQQVADLNDKVAELQEENKRLNAKVAELENANEELRRMVDPLKTRVAELEKENEKLRNMVDPLEAKVAQLQQKNAELEDELKRLRGNILMGQAVSSNCGGVDVFVGVAAPSMTVTTAGKQSNYVLDDSNGLGQSSPGMGLYKETQFFFRGARTGRYSVLLISRKEVRLAHREMMPLQQPAQACKVLVLLSAALSNGALRTVLTKQFTVDNYVTIVADLDVTNDAVQTLDPSPESLAWVQDQLDHAEKETSRASGSAGGGQAPEDGLPTDPRARHQKPAPGDESVRATQDSMRAKGGTPAPGQKPEGADDLKALRQKPQPAPAAVQELRKGVEQQPSSAPPQPGGQN